jgi:phosphate:Na+ symporter
VAGRNDEIDPVHRIPSSAPRFVGVSGGPDLRRMNLMSILGGVALVIFGVRFLRKGLDRLFGPHLIAWLQRMTTSRPRAFFAGVVTGTCSPSSTALSVVAVNMMTSGNLTAERMLAVLLGSGVGLTVTVQLLALHIETSAVWLLFFGVLGFQFLQREIYRGLGQCLIALGLIFLAMQIIGQASRTLAAEPDPHTIIEILNAYPWALLALAAILTVLVQSSTAAIGLGIGLAQGNLLSPSAMVAWVLGANLGIAVTLLIAGYPTLEARRLALAHLLIKATGVAAVLAALNPLTALLQALPYSLSRQTADFHTGFNAVLGLCALPLVPLFARLARILLGEPRGLREERDARQESFLSEDALETPSLALAHATREVLRMNDECQRMLAGFWSAYERRDIEAARQVQTWDDRVDHIYNGLKDYLSRITQDQLGEKLGQWQMMLLGFAGELEAVADIIELHLCSEAIKQVQESVKFSPTDAVALAEVFRGVRERLLLASSVLAVRDAKSARDFLHGQDRLNEFCRKVQHAHHLRIRSGDRETLLSSAAFLEMLGGFRRINSHLGTLGYALGGTGRGRRNRPAARAEAAKLPAADEDAPPAAERQGG